MDEFIRKFEVFSNDGDSLHISEYRKIIKVPPPENIRYGLPRFVTNNGTAVNYLDGGYQVLGKEKLYYEKKST
ncbi:hypothetical protein ACVSNX_14335 [Legionella pneumophila]